MTPEQIASQILRGYETDSGVILGIPAQYRKALQVLLETVVECALDIGPEDCKQCGCTHATAYDLGRADQRTDQLFSCIGKVTYGHLQTANEAVEAMRQKHGSALESYKCRHCDGYHIGH
jgi:hypothetical protein